MVVNARAREAHFSPAGASATFIETSRRYLGLAEPIRSRRSVLPSTISEFIDPIPYRVGTKSLCGRVMA